MGLPHSCFEAAGAATAWGCASRGRAEWPLRASTTTTYSRTTLPALRWSPSSKRGRKRQTAMLFEGIRKKTTRFAVGMTCGSAARGVDAALVRIKGTGANLHIKYIQSRHFP